jgi:hypothetical protein
MTRRFVKVFALIVFVCLYYACKCDNKPCPGLDAQFSAWLPYQQGDIITYANDSGQEIQFTVNRYEVSAPITEVPCHADSYGGCHCADCPNLSNEVFGETTDTSRRIVNAAGQSTKVLNNTLSIYVRQVDDYGKAVHVNYTICDHFNELPIYPSVTPDKGDSLLPSFAAGNHTYSNVITHQVDTTVKRYGNPIYNVYYVWKSYYNKEYGVIAFYDLKTNSFFYRKR